MTRLHYLCALLSAAFLLSIALAPAPAQAQEETRQATTTSQRPPESPSYYLRHSAKPIPQSTREQMPAPLLEKIRQERSRQEMNSRRQGGSGAKQQEGAANLVMRAGAGLSGVRGSSTSIEDVNGDGNQDLLIAGRDTDGSTTATLYLGDSQGVFTKANAGLVGVGFGASTSIADVDGDGNQDLLIVGGSDETATLYLGNGQGGFEEAGASLTGVDASSTSIADVDGDGNPDLLITGDEGFAESTTTLYLGDGQGGFEEASANLVGTDDGSTSIADVNGDGNPDLLITGNDENGDPTAILYLGNGQGGFEEAGASLTGVFNGSSTSIADVDGDGNPDLLITGDDENGGLTAILYLGNGQGGFEEAGASLTGVDASSTSIADVDGDGNPDLLITGSDENDDSTTTLYLGDGQGGFSEAGAGLTGTLDGSTSISDIDGDGDSDLLVTGLSSGAILGPSARIYVNRRVQSPPNRAPRFSRMFNYDRPLAPGVTLRRTVEAGDLDGDSLSIRSGTPGVSIDDQGNGIAEVVVTPTRNQGGNVVDFSIEASDSGGATESFSVPLEVPPVLSAFSASLTGTINGSTSIADVDRDGNQDLLITGEDELFSGDPTATLYLGDGQGSFSEAGAGLTETIDGSTSIADVDGDGNPDLLITGEDGLFSGDPTANLYLGDGQGSFSEAGASLNGVAGGSTSIADVDGDGNPDLLITGNGDNGRTTTLYLGDGQGGFSEADAGLADSAGSSTSIADVDGDGNPDLLIAGDEGFFSGETVLYIGDGQGGFSEAGAGLTGVNASSTSVADVDGDGNPDLLVAAEDENGDPTTTLYLGDGQGEFNEADAGLTGVVGSTSIADVDGDGNQDLLITGRNANFDPTATLYLGDGQGGFEESGAGLAGVLFSSSSIADIDGDTDPDLLVTGSSGASQSLSTLLYENLFDDPLPVELSGFEAATDGETVRLSWTTASETGNAGFRVQRRVGETTSGGETASGENGTWKQIGQVEGAGTTTEAKSYRFVDERLPYEADRLEYRLKQVDTDGSSALSDPVIVERSVDEVELLGTYPNPARSQATVRYALPEKQEVTLRLYDMLGRQVRTIAEGKRKGRQKRQVDVSGLPSGAYFLRLSADGQTRTQRLTVVR